MRYNRFSHEQWCSYIDIEYFGIVLWSCFCNWPAEEDASIVYEDINLAAKDLEGSYYYLLRCVNF